MAMVARCRVEVSAGTVRVSTGKYRCSMGLAEWRGAVSASMRGPVALPPGRGRGRVALANGLVVRAHGSDGAREVWRGSLERARPPLPPPPPRGRDRLGAMAPLLERVAEAVLDEQVAEIRALLPAYELRFASESPEDTLAAFGGEAWRVAERFVRRNVLGDDISRHIPQDVKVAVAVRDGGRCTATLPDGSRCPARQALHYDHRFVPFRLGGPQSQWNLTLLCASHNWSKGGALMGVRR